MNAEQNITAALDALEIRRLDKAIQALHNIYDTKAQLVGYDTFQTIDNDYQLMCQYMLRGYQDPQREQLYGSLIARLYKVVAELQLSWNCKNKTIFINAFRTADHLNLSHQFLRTVLESYVSDLALLSLEPETTRQTKQIELHTRHQTFIDRLFNALFVSTQWTKNDADFYADLLVSPTIDAADQMLMVSAITLACMNIFDIHKLETLIRTHLGAIDDNVSQRAYVGWVLSLTDNALFYDEQRALLAPFFSNETHKADFLNLQKQMFSCMDAERDTAKIERDIMPNIMKNSDIKFNRFGIEEREDDPMESIMNPDADEKKMEAMEENIQKMMKMQQQGSDIYFGGFSKMKNFPFFDHIANWFMPFYAQHPGLSEVTNKLGNTQLLDNLANKSPFCESDKYSLAFTMARIINQLPASMLEVLQSGEGIAFQEANPFGNSPAFSRRMYIQDLYRFFKVKMAYNTDIVNPFIEKTRSKAFFFGQFFFCTDDFKALKMKLALYLYQHKRKEELDLLLETFHIDTAQYHLLKGLSDMRQNDVKAAFQHFRLALDMEGNDEWVLKTVGANALKTKQYELAANCYTKLCEFQPQNRQYAINFSLAKIFVKQTKEALNKLYEWDLTLPSDNHIKRILAWALLCDGKAEKAFNIYEKLSIDQPLPDDFLNMGYAQWLSHNPAAAKSYFQQWKVKNPAGDLEQEFSNDAYMLEANEISHLDTLLMLSAVESE